jgi:hypothetical protein
MMDWKCRQAAIALWTLLSAAILATLATVSGNLAPALLSRGPRDALGIVALGLILLAHMLPLAAGLARGSRAPAPVPLGVIGGKA